VDDESVHGQTRGSLRGLGQRPGIPAEMQTKIWEPFFTTRQRGTGLGLAIVRKRIEEAGGTVRLVRHRTAKARGLSCGCRYRTASGSDRIQAFNVVLTVRKTGLRSTKPH